MKLESYHPWIATAILSHAIVLSDFPRHRKLAPRYHAYFTHAIDFVASFSQRLAKSFAIMKVHVAHALIQ